MNELELVANKNLPELPKGMKHVPMPDEDVISWSNADMRLSLWPLIVVVVGAGVFLLAALLLTYPVVNGALNDVGFWEKFAGLILISVLWFAFFLILLSGLSQMFQRETIRISNETITILNSGFFSPKPVKVNKMDVIALTFERVYSDPDDSSRNLLRPKDFERIYSQPRGGTPTLNLVIRVNTWGFEFWEWIGMANWLRAQDQRPLFFHLQTILQQRNWDIDYRVEEMSNFKGSKLRPFEIVILSVGALLLLTVLFRFFYELFFAS